MIYFIHGFEWPYDKKNTIRINEYNEPYLNAGKEKIIVLHSPVKYTKNHDSKEIHFDKVIYKYKPSDNAIVWNYGLVFNKNNFWQNLKLSIDKVVKQTPNIRKIRIPFSLFEKNCKKNTYKDLLVKIYNELSVIEQIDFFIILQEGQNIINKVDDIYKNFEGYEKCSDIINSKESQIVSYFDKVEKLDKPLILSGTKLGLGVCNFAHLIEQIDSEIEKSQKNFIEEINYFCDNYPKSDYFCFLETNKNSIDVEMNEIDNKYSKNLQKKDIQNYKNRISNFIKYDYYKLWFPLDRYRSYKLVYQSSQDLNIADNDIERFFKIFGYIKDYKNSEGYIPDSLANFINNKTKNKTNPKKSVDMMKLDHEIYTCLWGENFKDAPDYFKEKLEKEKNHFSEDTMKKLYPKKPQFLKERSRIHRRDLFIWFFYLKLKYDDVKNLFHYALCTFEDTYLPEDKILLGLFTPEGSNFPRNDILEFFLEEYKKALGDNYINRAKELGKSSLRNK